MKIIFYSEQCNFSKKLLDYINKNNLIQLFKLINIDNTKNIPSNIDSVPTIIDTDLNQYLKYNNLSVNYNKNSVIKNAFDVDLHFCNVINKFHN